MRKTDKLGLNLLEASDLLSPKPLNENMEKLEEALAASEERLGEALTESSDNLKEVLADSIEEQSEALTEKSEALSEKITANKTAIIGRVMMASGSYAGNSGLSVKISTPGFKPQLVLMRQKRELGTELDGTVYVDSFSVDGGWVKWAGEEYIPVNVLVGRSEIHFTAKQGSLVWESSYDASEAVYKSVNNLKGVTYEWVAFGYEEESGNGIQ